MFSILFTLGALVLAYALGGPGAALVAAILGVMEVSLSFDNAIVNATVLQTMSEKWQHRFLTWGIAIAVVGMRLAFPILIVVVIAQLGPMDVISMALSNPLEYAHHLESSQVAISSFGGAFLLMVFMSWAMDPEKDNHWLPLEKPLAKIGKLDTIQVVITMTALLLTGNLLVLKWGVIGLGSYLLLEAVTGLANLEDASSTINAGLASFIYLEVLDASFSFDGVMGAFAISRDIFIIALGLGIGAVWVRTMTLNLAKHGTLKQYEYLEHGAQWGIGILAILMLVSTFTPVPELVTGLVGVSFILASLGSSILKNNKQQAVEAH